MNTLISLQSAVPTTPDNAGADGTPTNSATHSPTTDHSAGAPAADMESAGSVAATGNDEPLLGLSYSSILHVLLICL